METFSCHWAAQNSRRSVLSSGRKTERPRTLSLSDNDQDFAATAPDKLAENTLQIVIDELLQSLNSSQEENYYAAIGRNDCG